MKRIISLLLVLIMAISFVTSCSSRSSGDKDDEGNTSVGTDTNAGANTNTNTGTNTNTNTNSGSSSGSDNKPTYTEDTLNYKPTTQANGKILYLSETLSAPELSKFYHNYDAAISMTFDDGDHIQTGYTLNELFAKYGFRGTLMVCAGNVKNNISEWQEVLDEGHLDIGCHGYYHVGPTSITDNAVLKQETVEAVEFLRSSFPTQRVLTFATPLANITDEYEAELRNLVISNRLEGFGNKVVPGGEYNIYRVQAASFNTRTSLGYINAKADDAVKNGEWLVELMHGVVDGERYGTDVDKVSFSNHCEYLYNNYKNNVWFGSFEDVSVYVTQYEHSQINYVACDRESMTFTITTDESLDKDIYNIPMSATIYVPSFTDSAYYVIDGVEYDLEVKKLGSRGKRYVEILDVPNDGTEVKIYLGGNNKCNNGCVVHSYYQSEIVESTCTTHGYTVYECSDCLHTYKKKYKDFEHDYTGDEIEIDGVTYVQCLYCDAKKVKR